MIINLMLIRKVLLSNLSFLCKMSQASSTLLVALHDPWCPYFGSSGKSS